MGILFSKTEKELDLETLLYAGNLDNTTNTFLYDDVYNTTSSSTIQEQSTSNFLNNIPSFIPSKKSKYKHQYKLLSDYFIQLHRYILDMNIKIKKLEHLIITHDDKFIGINSDLENL